MSEEIVSAAGDGKFGLRVTSNNRAFTDGIVESLSAQMSRDGMLYGTGTGYLSVGWTDDFYQVLWLRNDDPDNLFHVQKLIFGWNGGTSSRNVMARSFILYQTSEPSTANADASPAIENISKSGTASAHDRPWKQQHTNRWRNNLRTKRFHVDVCSPRRGWNI